MFWIDAAVLIWRLLWADVSKEAWRLIDLKDNFSKIKLFANLQAVPNLYEFLSVEHKKNEC